jgi:hypothetical protein
MSALRERPKRGRPTKYTEALADEICDRIAASEIGLARMLDDSSDLPCSRTVWTWMAEKPEFLQKVNAAKERQLELMQYRGVELIDGVEIEAPHASVAIAQAKASADARFKLAAKIAPRRYGSQLNLKQDVDRRPVIVYLDEQDKHA